MRMWVQKFYNKGEQKIGIKLLQFEYYLFLKFKI